MKITKDYRERAAAKHFRLYKVGHDQFQAIHVSGEWLSQTTGLDATMALIDGYVAARD